MKLNKKLFFCLSLLSLIFLSTIISVMGYPNNLLLNDADDDQVLPENQSGTMYLDAYGDGSYSSGTTYYDSYETTTNYIPDYDYSDGNVKIYPQYYFKQITSSAITFSGDTSDSFFKSGYEYKSNLAMRTDKLTYHTRYPNQIAGKDKRLTGGRGEDYFNKAGLEDTNTQTVVATGNDYELFGGVSYAWIELATEITNTDQGGTGSFNYQSGYTVDYVDFQITLHKNARDWVWEESLMGVGDRVEFGVELMYRYGGVDQSVIIYNRVEPSGGCQRRYITYAEIIAMSSYVYGEYNTNSGGAYGNGYSRIRFRIPETYLSHTWLTRMTNYAEHSDQGWNGVTTNPQVVIRIYAKTQCYCVFAEAKAWVLMAEANTRWGISWNRGGGSFNNDHDVYINDGSNHWFDRAGGTINFRTGEWQDRLMNIFVFNFYTDFYNSYDSITGVEIDNISGYYYDLNTALLCNIQIISRFASQQSTHWLLTLSDMDVIMSPQSTYSKIGLTVTPTDLVGWLGIVFKYEFTFGLSGFSSAHPYGFKYSTSFSYSSGYREYIYSLSGYSRSIDIDWKQFNLYNTYLKQLRINDIVVSDIGYGDVGYGFQGYTPSDVPIWITNPDFDWIPTWEAGSTPKSLNLKVYTDTANPVISDWAITNSMFDGDPVEFNVTGTDDIVIKEAFLILEDTTTFHRKSLALSHKTGNVYYYINQFGDIIPNTYNAWYGIQDNAGNWQTSPSFTLFVNSTFLFIDLIFVEGYEYGTTGHLLNFSINNHYPNEYYVKIDDIVIDSGFWINHYEYSLNLDGYEIGIHNISIYANDTVGKEKWNNTSFRVYQTPIILEKSIDTSYILEDGSFEVFWNVSDNGLSNYTILRNQVPIVEKDFTDPYNERVFIINNTLGLGIGTYNYTIIIRDNDTLIVQDSVFIQIGLYIAPIINIVEPTLTIIEDINPQSIQVNITQSSMITSVQWDLKRPSWNYSWELMIYNPINELWEATFDPMLYEYGDYILWINVSDPYYDNFEHTDIILHQFIIYTINISEIIRVSNDINVGVLEEFTTDIIGHFLLNHSPIVKERDFGIFIPIDYEDAFEYYINRGFFRYEPLGFFVEGVYTEWSLPDYQSNDTVYFELIKPTIFNEPVVEREDGTVEVEFTLASIHTLTNLTIKNTLYYFISDTASYKYKVEYLYQGEWYEVEVYELHANAFIDFELDWDSIEGGTSVIFRFTATPISEEVSPFNWTLGAIFIPIGLFFWVLFAGVVGRKWEDWGVPKFVLYSIIVAGASFGIGILFGFLIQGSTYALIIPYN